MIRHVTGILYPVASWSRTAVPYRVIRTLGTTATEAGKRFQDKVHQTERNIRKSSPEWLKRKESLVQRYGHWNPTRKLSRQQMQDIRSLKGQMPYMKTIDFANHFRVSPEAIRRILRSNWIPNDKEEELLQMRNAKRKEKRKKKTGQKKVQSLESDNSEKPRESKSSSSDFSVDGTRKASECFTNIKPLAFGTKPKQHSKKVGLRIRHQKKPYTNSVSDVID